LRTSRRPSRIFGFLRKRRSRALDRRNPPPDEGKRRPWWSRRQRSPSLRGSGPGFQPLRKGTNRKTDR